MRSNGAEGWSFRTREASPGPKLGMPALVAVIGAAVMIFAQRQFWSARG